MNEYYPELTDAECKCMTDEIKKEREDEVLREMKEQRIKEEGDDNEW